MNKRQFLKNSLVLGIGLWATPWQLFSSPNPPHLTAPPRSQGFSLPQLPYSYNALVPYIDAQTMEIHHQKHHAAYIKNLNTAIADTPFAQLSITDICKQVTENQAIIRNNGGGHLNHTFFWESLSPQAKPLAEKKTLHKAIKQSFGSIAQLQEQFNQAAALQFGSGWAWLCADSQKKLFICSTPNQDNPLMKNIVKQQGTPLLALDVWEHAYYLQYQNKRLDYIKAFWNIVNWQKIQQRFEAL